MMNEVCTYSVIQCVERIVLHVVAQLASRMVAVHCPRAACGWILVAGQWVSPEEWCHNIFFIFVL
jgi:hypothetical protein